MILLLLGRDTYGDVDANYKVFVMAPLFKIDDWQTFKKQLMVLKKEGVYGVTTDIWWGDVEKTEDNNFDWRYYKDYARTVQEAGIKWVPILSTHALGSYIPLPNWIWAKADSEVCQFKDEDGRWSKDSVSLWWNEGIQQVDELYASFAANFLEYKEIIAKIYLSCGPSGELRFPSFNFQLGWKYPERGKFQAYSESAINDFRETMKFKYRTISRLNKEWGEKLSDFAKVMPPGDGESFLTDAKNTNYGQDFLTWYQGSLEKHLRKLAKMAHRRFDKCFKVELGAKIAGIHWLKNHPQMRNAAEYCAGYFDYEKLIDQFRESNISLTFTCLEMDDSKADTSPEYSLAKSLVIQVARIAHDKGVKIYGENALIMNSFTKYSNVAELLFNYNFSGFTLMRMGAILDQNGEAKEAMDWFRQTIMIRPVKVVFTVKALLDVDGEMIYLIGDKWELGGWQPQQYAIPLKRDDDAWRTTLYLGANKSYEFKALKKDKNGNICIEEGGNRRYEVPVGGGFYEWHWEK